MNYVDHSTYKHYLEMFAKGESNKILKENYADLRALGTFEGKITDISSTVNQTYAGAKEMEEGEVENPGKYKPKPYDKDGDGVPNGADKNPLDGSTNEGLAGYQLENLSVDERNELKAYVESIKTTKKAISELVDKARGMQKEGGNNTGLTLNKNPDTTSEPTGEEPIQ